MTLAKAKEILQLNIDEVGSKMPDDTLDALKLGVEAINYVQDVRHIVNTPNPDYLPGETHENPI